MYPFLTPERLALLQTALIDSDNRLKRILIADSDYFKDAKKRERSFMQRAYLCNGIRHHLAGVDGVEIGSLKGVYVLIFDQKHVMHLKKVTSELMVAKLPKSLVGSAKQYLQPQPGEYVQLSYLDQFDVEELKFYVGAYVSDENGTLLDFYVNDQQGDEVISSYHVDLPRIVEEFNNEADSLKPRITLKGSRKVDKDARES